MGTLELDTGGFIVVRSAPEPLLEIEAADRAYLLRIAWHLGNRHLPLQVVGERLRVRADHVIADLVTGLGGRIAWVEAPFDPETGAYAGSMHSHGSTEDDGDIWPSHRCRSLSVAHLAFARLSNR